MLKSHLVSNATLRQLCIRYKITDHIIAAPVQLLTIKSQEKPVASIFEAYIAAVFYDYLTSDMPGAYTADNIEVDDDGASSETTDEVSVTGATADDESVQGDGEVDIAVDTVSRAQSVVNGQSSEGLPPSVAVSRRDLPVLTLEHCAEPVPLRGKPPLETRGPEAQFQQAARDERHDLGLGAIWPPVNCRRRRRVRHRLDDRHGGPSYPAPAASAAAAHARRCIRLH